jgi:hypothetical protein
MIGMLAMAQAAAAASPAQTTADPCARGPNNEIVVCGTRPGENPYQLPELADKYRQKPLRAETDVFPGVHAQAHVQSEKRGDGLVAKRLLVTFSVPF